MKSCLALLLLAQLLTVASSAVAQPQSYGPLNFDLPPGWLCRINDGAMACLDQKEGPETAAMIINYKDIGPDDKLDIYRNQLSQPRILKDGEISAPSEVRAVREIELNGVKWVEGAHLSSEINDYYTHYFVTAVAPYAYMVAISVHKSAYPTDFAKLKPTLDSLKITSTAPTSATAPANFQPSAPSNDMQVIADETDEPVKDHRKYFTIGGHKILRSYALLGIIFVLVVMLLGYALLS
jgi:hypothetical protein